MLQTVILKEIEMNEIVLNAIMLLLTGQNFVQIQRQYQNRERASTPACSVAIEGTGRLENLNGR